MIRGDDPAKGPIPGPRLTQPAARLDAQALLEALKRGLAGHSPESAPSDPLPPAVVWVDEGDEALVHIDATSLRLLDGMLLVAVELETDQAGRQSLALPFALGRPGEAAGLLATTDVLPRGEPLTVARWGRVVQDAVWASLLAATRAAVPPESAPVGIGVAEGHLVVDIPKAEAPHR